MKRPAGWVEAVEKATGYEHSAVLAIVRRRGANVRTCTLEEIVAHVRAYLRERDERRQNRPPKYVPTGARRGRVLRADDKRKAPKRPVTFGGETLALTEWARRCGVPLSTMYSRIDQYGEHEALARSLAQPGPWSRGASRRAA